MDDITNTSEHFTFVFDEPPPNEDDFKIAEVDRDGNPVLWTMEDALEGNCDFEMVGHTKYYGEEVKVYTMVRRGGSWDGSLLRYINQTVGDVMADRFGTAKRQWENRKNEAEVNTRLNGFLRLNGSQLNDYLLSTINGIPMLRNLHIGFLSSPIVVINRTDSNGGRQVGVYLLTPEQKWVWVSIPAAELNDHGAKLRARLLHYGANVSVDTVARKSLLHFILNAKVSTKGRAA